MRELSVLIPARNEMFLAKTIENVLENIEADTEIIVVLDGVWADPPIQNHERVTIVYLPEAIGQRAATNLACRLSTAKYVMKLDAHCAVGEGFDRIMIEDMQDDITMIPAMHNLHAFDWLCSCGHRIYQGPTPEKCAKCGGPMTRDIIWCAKPSPYTTAMRFDKDLRFQYWGEYKNQQRGDLVETMSILGACFMLTREKYWELDICDEAHGSWGQQGTEVSCKTWLSGGRVLVNKRAWFAHMFRTQGGDFSFPYPLSGKAVNQARKHSNVLWMQGKWDKAIHPLSWLIDRFNPPGWDSVPTKGLIYYTDSELDENIAAACRNQLDRIDIQVVSVSLKPLNFGRNIHLPLKRGYLTMAKQILAALEASGADVIYFCEHDVLYHPSHFAFIPPKKDVYYYNRNVWKVSIIEDRFALHYDCDQLSGLCAYREFLITHYRERVRRIETEGFSRRMGFEPGTHNRPERVDDFKAESWQSEYPNIDIRHDKNLTSSRWSQDQFRNKKFCAGWKEADAVPGWGSVASIRELVL